jgi:hypothetical protein
MRVAHGVAQRAGRFPNARNDAQAAVVGSEPRDPQASAQRRPRVASALVSFPCVARVHTLAPLVLIGLAEMLWPLQKDKAMTPFRYLLVASLASSLAGLVACAETDTPEAASSESELSATACVGAACTALPPQGALQRGALAAVGHELFWLVATSTLDATGTPLDELRHCTLPACDNVSALPLVLNGVQLRDARNLQTANDAVVFVGYLPGKPKASLFVADGSSLAEVYADFDDQHDRYAVDAQGALIFKRDRRTDGWAKSTLRHCAWNGRALATACATYKDAALNHVNDLKLTPTRAVVSKGYEVWSYDRASLGAAQREPLQDSQNITYLVGAGEDVLGWKFLVTPRGGRVEHDTVYFAGAYGTTTSGMLDGKLSATSSDATRIYIGTMGEGDVWGRPKTGVLAKVFPKTGIKHIRATQQDVHGVAVDGARLYWLDGTGSPPDAEGTAVIRTVAR